MIRGAYINCVEQLSMFNDYEKDVEWKVSHRKVGDYTMKPEYLFAGLIDNINLLEGIERYESTGGKFAAHIHLTSSIEDIIWRQ